MAPNLYQIIVQYVNILQRLILIKMSFTNKVKDTFLRFLQYRRLGWPSRISFCHVPNYLFHLYINNSVQYIILRRRASFLQLTHTSMYFTIKQSVCSSKNSLQYYINLNVLLNYFQKWEFIFVEMGCLISLKNSQVPISERCVQNIF